jgi:photosystem II stability/assembly factor-like uncharacterized protein
MRILLIISFIILMTTAWAQWDSLYCSSTIRMKSVEFLDSDLGYMCGYSGYVSGMNSRILKTEDGGVTWYDMNINETAVYPNAFNSISFANSNYGVAVGNHLYIGKIFQSYDYGSNWDSVNIEVIKPLTYISMINDTHGIAVGDSGVIVNTINAGETWDVNFIGTGSNLKSTYFKNDNIGFVVGEDGAFFKSYNGGISWVQVNIGFNYDLNDISFSSDLIGYIVCNDGKILKTENGGDYWMEINTKTGFDFNKISVINDTIIFVASNYSLLKTTNAFSDWSFQNNNSNHNYRNIDIDFPSDSVGYVLNNSGNGKRILFKTDYQGDTSYYHIECWSAFYETGWEYFDCIYQNVPFISIRGGKGPYQYFWNSSNYIVDSTNLSIEFIYPCLDCLYSLTVVDSNNDTASFDIIFDIYGPISSYSVNDASCDTCGDGSITLYRIDTLGNGWHPYIKSENEWVQLSDEVVLNDSLYFNISPGLYSFKIVDNHGCEYYLDSIIVEPYNYVDLIKNERLLIYPNPTSDFIVISGDYNISKIEVFSFNGRKCIEILKPDKEIDISSLKDGMYILRVYTADEVVSEKIILSR